MIPKSLQERFFAIYDRSLCERGHDKTISHFSICIRIFSIDYTNFGQLV